MNRSVLLSYISSGAIINFCANNPIRWGNQKLANEDGNLKTPTPAIEVFFRLLAKTDRLFTQEEYVQFAWLEWSGWQQQLKKAQQEGIKHRLSRNFYPSAIDSLHVWSLLVETGKFDKCTVSTVEDAVGKVDITVWPVIDCDPIKIALRVENAYTKKWTDYKRSYRGKTPDNIVDILLTMDRPRKPGNKRWYNLNDLAPVFEKIDESIFPDTMNGEQLELLD